MLRIKHNREPSAAEVEQHLLDGRRVDILQRDITSAFRKGEEVRSRNVLPSISSCRE